MERIHWPRDFSEKGLFVQGSQMKKKKKIEKKIHQTSWAAMPCMPTGYGIWLARGRRKGKGSGFLPRHHIQTTYLPPADNSAKKGFPMRRCMANETRPRSLRLQAILEAAECECRWSSPPGVPRHRRCGLCLFSFLIPGSNR